MYVCKLTCDSLDDVYVISHVNHECYLGGQRIDLLYDLVVRQVDIKALWPYLFINGIFNFDDYNLPDWSKDITNPEIMGHNFFISF